MTDLGWRAVGDGIRRCALGSLVASAVAVDAMAGDPQIGSPFGVVDLAIGESTNVALADGRAVAVSLIGLEEARCELRGAVRRVDVAIEINGARAQLTCATYNLPTIVGGVQVDCPVTRGYTEGSSKANVWALDKDARLRLWPVGAPWIQPGTFDCPLSQRWFATDTQMGNDPCYVNACDIPGETKIYYHYGQDFGGAEGMERVTAATDGTVVSRAGAIADGEHPSLVKPRADVVYLRDDRGWYYRYSHLMSIDPAVVLGARVARGSPIGVLGKEGGSGGWSHLHFDISMPQPSGRYGITDGYALLFDAYRRRHDPGLVAVARPHRVAWAGEEVELDGTRSWHAGGIEKIRRFEWSFTDGTSAEGPVVRRAYRRPGHYTETLKVSDEAGDIDYDFAVVQVFDRENTKPVPPSIHAAYWPTLGVGPGSEITFKVRTFGVRPDEGMEVWDFGDGSPPVQTRSDGNAQQHAADGYAVTTHRYAKPGHYVVSVSRADDRGITATGRLHVEVEGPRGK